MISQDQDDYLLSVFLAKHPAAALGLRSEQRSGEAGDANKVQGLPETFLTGRIGTVRHYWSGFRLDEEPGSRAQVEAILGIR